MTHPNREELAGLLEQRAERLVLRPGELATYCPLDADLDRKAAAALRQSPSVEEVEWHILSAMYGPLSATEAAQAIDALYQRGGGS